MTGRRAHGVRSLTLLFPALWLAACAHKPEPMFQVGRQERVAVTDGSAEGFVPLVPPSTADARCEDLRNPPAMLGARVLSLVFGDPQERRVTVSLDEQGRPTSYADMRGSLMTPDGHQLPQTTVTLDLVRRQAFASNRPDLDEQHMVRIPFEEALTAESLARPGEMLDRVMATCGGGG